jgi:hypothetical protein
MCEEVGDSFHRRGTAEYLDLNGQEAAAPIARILQIP